jgi:hypothetical protein
MFKRFFLALVAIFAAWTAIDLLLHRFVLGSLYSSTPLLWRPVSALNVPLIYSVIFILIASFFLLFELLVSPKTLRSGLQLGAIFGLAIGISVGFGTYIHMPVPLGLAWGWFLGGWVKALVAGAILGALPRP